MTSFDIPDDIAEKVTDAVFGPDSHLSPARVEIVHMALVEAAPDLYRLWVQNRPTCPSRSPFGSHCQLPAGHPAWHQGYLGSSELAWMDKANEVIPLPASIDTEATS